MSTQPELAPAPAPSPALALARAPEVVPAVHPAPAEVSEPAAEPEAPPRGEMSNDEKAVWSTLDGVVAYFRSLGVASAVGVGALAIMKYREELFPGLSFIPFATGVVLLAITFFLLVFISMQFVRVNFAKSKTWKMLLATFFSFTISFFFVRVGFITAVTALNAQQAKPTLQKTVDTVPVPTQVAVPAPAQPSAKAQPPVK